MSLRFSKMHGLGNDFMVFETITQAVDLKPIQIATLANRHTGIGFDQCLIIEPSTQRNVDFFYRIFNADGQEVGQCGNGARCIARFIQHFGLSQNTLLRVATKTTQLDLSINPDQTVTVDMGLPLWDPQTIPLKVTQEAKQYALPLTLATAPTTHQIHAVNVGNPHAVVLVNNLNTVDIQTIGKAISEHPWFPKQANVGFMQLVDSKNILLRVYERGCGETLACGSGAVAAAAVGIRFHQLASSVNISLPGGELTVDWPDQNQGIRLSGPAEFVYDGVLHPCALSF